MLGFALFPIEAFQQGSQFLDLAPEGKHAAFFVTQGAFQVVELAQDFAQLALHRKRPFGALFSASHGDIVEAFAGLRKKESIGIFEGQPARYIGFRNDVSVAQLGKNDFQRFSKSVEHANGVLEGHDLGSGRRRVRRLIQHERKFSLRVLRVDEESRASVDIGAQHAEAFVSGVPGFDHDVVELIAQKIFDDTLVARFDFEEVGQHAHWRQAALHHPGLEQAAHRFCGVSVLGDDGLERAFFAESGRVFGAEHVEVRLASRFVELLGFDQAAKLADFFRDPADPLRDGFEFEGELSTLSAKSFHLQVRVRDFGFETARLAVGSGETFFRLRQLIAKARGGGHRVEDGDA